MGDRNRIAPAELLLTRRKMLHGLGLAIASAPIVHLLGCANDSSGSTSGETTAAGTDGGGTTGAETDGGTTATPASVRP